MSTDERALDHILERARNPEAFDKWVQQAKSAHWCTSPVRLVGSTHTVDRTTGELLGRFNTNGEPDGTLVKACGQRRATACPECAKIYRVDAWHLIVAGLRGGKGVPDWVIDHPLLFVTLTAPSFGPVHSRREANGRARRCRPSGKGDCAHGLGCACQVVHDDDDPRIGEPLCPACFDYRAAVLWNSRVTELWRRTTIRINRELAHTAGLTLNDLSGVARLSYAKVVEYQARGVVHLHVVLRLDGPNGPAEPPPSDLAAAVLEIAVRSAARAIEVAYPTVAGIDTPARWGTQLDVRHIATNAAPAAAVAAYIAKYATKSTDALGRLDHRLTSGEVRALDLPPHLHRMVTTAWELGGEPELAELRLRQWAHTLGFRGHWLTKSRRYSTTFGELRSARVAWTGRRHERSLDGSDVVAIKDWRFAGRGWANAGDEWLAQSGADRAAETRQLAREARRVQPEIV